MRIGVISDTHGLLRPEAVSALTAAKVEHILHAGDVGDIGILGALGSLAPVTAIRGNIDTTGPCARLPATDLVQLGAVFFYLVHSIADLDIDPVAAGAGAVISGHSHRPGFCSKNGTLYLNPGSAGPRRFQLPVTLATIDVTTSGLIPELITLL